MNEQIRQAIADRREKGYSDEQIIAEFVAVGYSEAQARELVLGSVTHPAPVALVVPTAPVVSSDPSTPPLVDTGTKRYLLLAGLGVIGCIVLVLTVAFAFSGSPSWLTALLGQPPYQSEHEFLVGMIQQSREMDAFSSNVDFSLSFHEAESMPDGKTHESIDAYYELMNILGIAFPNQGHVRLEAEGSLDRRNEEAPEADIALSVDLALGSSTLATDVAYRVADGSFFIKVEDMTTIIGDANVSAPSNRWIRVDSIDVADIYSSISKQDPPTMTPLEQGFSLDTLVRGMTELAQSLSPIGRSNLALMAEAPVIRPIISEEEPDLELSDEAKALGRAELIAHPPIRFKGEPQKTQVDGRTAFLYTVAFDQANLDHLIGFLSELSYPDGTPYFTETEVEELRFFSESVSVLDSVLDVSVYVSPRGDLIGIGLTANILPTNALSGVRIDFRSFWEELPETFDISAPTDAFDRSLEEILDEYELLERNDRLLRREVEGMMIVASLFGPEELYPANLCQQITLGNEEELNVTCRSSAYDYVIFGPLRSTPGFYCGDASDEFGRVETEPELTSTLSCPPFVEESSIGIDLEEMLSAFAAESVPAARATGIDASIKQSLGNLRSQAEIVYNRNGDFNYSKVCADRQVQQLLDAAAQHGNVVPYRVGAQSSTMHVTCNDSFDAYAVSAPLVGKPGLLWCVDSTGYAGEVTALALAHADDYECSTSSSKDVSYEAEFGGWLQHESISLETMVLDSDHVRGNRNADVVLIEYCGYADPFCQMFHQSLLRMMREWGETGKVAWVFRHYPIEQLHPRGMSMAIAGECVAEVSGNEAFWDFTDSVYVLDHSYDSFDMPLIHQLASTFTGSDYPLYKECYDTERTRSNIETMMVFGDESDLQGTPHSIMFLASDPSRSAVIVGAQPYEQVSQYIRGLLAE